MKSILKISSFLLISFNLLYGGIQEQDLIPMLYTENYNSCMAQDKEGFLWIGTADGLVKYDGYTKEQYNYDNFFISSIIVVSLLVDSENIIWISTIHGLYSYNKTTNQLVSYKTEPKTPNSISSNAFNWAPQTIAEDKDGLIWIGTKKGLNSYNKKTGTFVRYLAKTNGLCSDNILAVFVDTENMIWIGTDKGLCKYNKGENSFTAYKHENVFNSLLDNCVKSITEDKNGDIWIGTKGGLSRYNKKANSYVAYIHNPDYSNSLEHNDIFSLFVDKDNNLWICHPYDTSACAEKYDINNGKFISCSTLISKTNSEKPAIINCFQDKAGTLWLIDNKSQIYRLALSKERIKTYKYNKLDRNTLRSNDINVITEDGKYDLWIGTGRGISKFDDKTEGFIDINFHDNNVNLTDENITILLKDNDGIFWIGTGNGNLYAFDKSMRLIKKYKNSLLTGFMTIMLQDLITKDVFWIGSEMDGFFKFNKKTGIFKQYKNNPNDSNSLSNNTVDTNIFQDEEGIIWLPTLDGLNRFDPALEHFKNYRHTYDNDSVSGDNIIDCYIDSYSNFWISTITGGLNKFDKKKERFIRYGTECGLKTKSIRSIIEDNNHNLWITTSDAGLIVFNIIKEKVIDTYDVTSGIQGNRFSPFPKSTIKRNNGELWFSGFGGITRIDPEILLKKNAYIPPIYLTSLSCQGDSQIIKKQSIGVAKNITLPWNKNSFEFEFVALNYNNSLRNQYSYKLEGFDKEWNYIGTAHSGRYTNISPGEYTLRLKGSNNDGIWNEKGTSVTIIIKPPFWMTWWFKGLGGIILLGVILAIFHTRNRVLKKRAIYMRDHAIAETTSLVAHDVRKPFTALKAMLHILPTLSPEKVETYSRDIDRSIRKVDAMLSDILEASREVEYQFTPENILSILDLAIKDVASRYPNKKVKFYYQLKTIPLINLDEHRMCRALDNIIANAFDFLPDKEGFMWFSVEQEGEMTRIVIGNSHSNIPEDKIMNIFQNKFTLGKQCGTGLGLRIVSKVINGHKGSVSARNVEKAARFVPDSLKYINGVEFEIMLPLTEKPGYDLKDPLLTNSEEAKSVFGMTQKSSQLAGSSSIDNLIEKFKSLEKKPNLLILDDESIYRTRVRDVLENLGEVNNLIHAYDASSYKEAIDLLTHAKIDFLICDIDLSDKQNTGFSVLSYAVKKYPECKVLMHTNRKDSSDIGKAKKLGACGYCPKPITEAILVDLLLNNALWPENYKKEQANQFIKYAKVIPNSKILLVDDEEMNLEYKKSFIRAYTNPQDNIQLYMAKTYKEATGIIDSVNPDVLVTDFNLASYMTGVDICQYMKKKNSTSVCVVSSNMHRNELNNIKNENKNSIDEVFSTSYSMKEILSIVFEIMEKHTKNSAYI